VIQFRATAVKVLLAAGILHSASHCAASTSFTTGIQTGTIQNSSIIEASGIAASRMNPNVLWTFNDSGGGNHIFPLTSDGTNLGDYTVTGATNSDWEDIAIGPGPVAGTQYLYIGEIGDNPPPNNASIGVYRIPEPVVSDTQSPVTTSISGAVKFTFEYPDGPHDAESLFVDPLTKDIYIVTKQINPSVYRAAYPQSTSGTTTLTLAATFTSPNPPTAADMSPDGNEIIVRGYPTSSGLLFQRPAGGTVADAFATTPISIPLMDEGFQGEAIGFDPLGHGYYTTREGASRPIFYFDRLPPPASNMYWDNDGLAAGSYVATGTGMGGSGTWDTMSQKWYNASADIPWTSGNDAIFWGAAGTVTLGAAQAVNSLTFKSSGYTITGSTLTLSESSVTVDAGVTATISSVLAGTAGLVKNGAGTLVLTNSSNQTSGYTGGTTINAGTLNIASGTISHSGVAVTINNGATLQFTGNFTLAAARSVTLGTGGGLIDTNGNNDTIAGVIGGTSINKVGAGTLTLTNANSYSGGTTVSAGTLRVNNTLGSGTGTGLVSVAASAVLGGTGTIQGNVTNSGTVAPGNGIGTLHLGGSYSQFGGSKLEVELAPGGAHDELVVAGAATLGGSLSVLLSGGYVPQAGDAFEIVSASGFSGNILWTTTLPVLWSGLVWNFDYGATSVTLSVKLAGDFNADDSVNVADYVTWRGSAAAPANYYTWREQFGQEAPSSGTGGIAAAVPEPATWMMCAMAAAVFFFRARRAG
jgi:autotransporter-associated beta strand protein